MNMNKETEEKIGQLQLIEQNLRGLVVQKQTFQSQLLEIENALEELKNAKGTTYKIVGTIMIASEKDSLNKDLGSKKEMLELRIKNLEGQEKKLREKTEGIQQEVMKKLKK